MGNISSPFHASRIGYSPNGGIVENNLLKQSLIFSLLKQYRARAPRYPSNYSDYSSYYSRSRSIASAISSQRLSDACRGVGKD